MNPSFIRICFTCRAKCRSCTLSRRIFDWYDWLFSSSEELPELDSVRGFDCCCFCFFGFGVFGIFKVFGEFPELEFPESVELADSS